MPERPDHRIATEWRVAQCRKTVREGEAELAARRRVLAAAEQALREINAPTPKESAQ